MSLINDALKKAQQQTQQRLPPGGTQQMEAVSHPKPRGSSLRRYLRGFILSVLIVGILSTALSYYFISQLLEEDQAPGPSQTQHPPEPEPVESPPLVEEVPAPPEPIVESMPEPEPPPEAPQPPDPAVAARLLELEIRGVMSGSTTKVLLQDAYTGKTRSYAEGDTLEGPLGLKIETIEPDAVIFTDYGGRAYTKGF